MPRLGFDCYTVTLRQQDNTRVSISFSGLASGLDTSSWVESLVALKRAKVTTLQEQKENIIYFNDLNTAALWVIKYIARNVSPKKNDAVRKIECAIAAAPQTKKCRYNCYWEYSPEGAIAAVAKEN